MPIVNTPRYKEFVKLLQKRLPEKRAMHCIFVAEYIASFAESIGVDHDKAVTAGLLHDYCRCLSNDTMIAHAERYGVPISALERERPILLHGPVAAAEINLDLDVYDEEILEAITWHTTGRRNLGRLGCALYVADYAEPGRKYPEAAQARDILRKEGFDEALYFAASQKHARMMESDKPPVPAAIDFHDWIEELYG